ncbi:hypothetical protein Psi02_00110 [Planotetraspora silvatica]|uniref:Uncharacterized protein n=1 Tax=Planotetraspora silvatica TaxID=234614 RepID=A0A8J3UH46_9ACTN|nr:hypothetical protein Psi02_00110 [Planotetraspora silvatica]
MFSLPALLTLIGATVVATIACALVLSSGALWPTALLSGGAAGGATLGLLPRLLKDHDDSN